MKPSLKYRSALRLGSRALALMALSLLAAAGFLWISDDFVLQGQVVPATDARIMLWRISLTLGGLLCGVTAFVCYQSYRALCQERVADESGIV